MKQKHLLFSALLVVGSQFSFGQDAPLEQRILEVDAKLAMHQNSPHSISSLLTKEEHKLWSDFYAPDKGDHANNFRGEGSLFWFIDGVTSSLYNTPKAGPYSLDTVAGAQGDALYCDDVNGAGVLYALNNDTRELVEVFDNGTTEVVATLSGINVDQTLTGLSWNSADDLFYVLSTDGDLSFIYSLDVATGAATLVKEFTEIPLGIWLEFDDSNNTYITDISTDIVYVYNLPGDTLTELGAAGLPLSYAQDVDYDSETGKLYTAYFADDNGNYDGGIAEVDMATGAYNIIHSFGVFEGITFSIAEDLAVGEDPVLPTFGCGDVFTDSGGVDGDYPSGADEVFNIEPSAAGEAVTITFTKVEIEGSSGTGVQDGCWDYLSIYNGPDVNSPVLAATLCGRTDNPPSVESSILSPGDSFTSTDSSGALTVTFKSDSSVNYEGWEADVTCASLAVDNVHAAKFNYYPNPTNGLLKVTAKSNIEKLELYNVVGQKVSESKPGLQDVTLDMSNLKPGVYILNATVNGKVLSNKIIKK